MNGLLEIVCLFVQVLYFVFLFVYVAKMKMKLYLIIPLCHTYKQIQNR